MSGLSPDQYGHHGLIIANHEENIHKLKFLTLVRTGVVATPLRFFPDNFFWQPKVAKWVHVFYTNPITRLFTKMNPNLGELSKLSVEGGW